MKYFILIFLLSVICIAIVFPNERQKIYSIEGKEIYIFDNWAGQSITLIKEKNAYYIIRKFFGSGVPVVNTFKYKADIISDYQIRFSEIINGKRHDLKEIKIEMFTLNSADNGEIQLLLNGIQVKIKKP